MMKRDDGMVEVVFSDPARDSFSRIWIRLVVLNQTMFPPFFDGMSQGWSAVRARLILSGLAAVAFLTGLELCLRFWNRPARIRADESGLSFREKGLLSTCRYARWSGVSLVDEGPLQGVESPPPILGPLLRVNSSRFLFKVDLGRVPEPDRTRLLEFIRARMGRPDPPIQPSRPTRKDLARKVSPVAAEPVDHPLWDDELDGP